MKESGIPSCYFPSTVYFVDDDINFLNALAPKLRDKIAFKMFSSPSQALNDVIAKKQTAEDLNHRCVSEYLETHGWPGTNHTLNLDLAPIHWEVYNPSRFSEVTVVVVDYTMSGINGLSFCEKLNDIPVKKILLTDDADENIVIQAFNDGIINRFIKKNDPDMVAKILDSVKRLQYEYFHSMSDVITKMLSIHSPSCLQDKKFITFFQNICRINNIVEYYLTENTGSFLLIDERGQCRSLLVKTVNDLKLHYDLALDNKAPQEALDQLKSGEKIPCFWHTDGLHSEWSDWSTCLVPANKIECNQTYYYALVQGSHLFDIQQDRISSYREYLASMTEEESALAV